MSLWAIVPVKPLRRGKSRLAGVLTEDERTMLNYSMLGHTLKTLSAVPEIQQTLVVSRDPAALSLAREYGARTVREEGSPHLNLALNRASALAKVYATEGILILPADLPLVVPKDIQMFLSKLTDPPVVVIHPDRRNTGTNALAISPAGLIDYSFGPGSFRRHCERAVKAGARLEVCQIASIGLDLDLPDDLEIVRKMQVLEIDSSEVKIKS